MSYDGELWDDAAAEHEAMRHQAALALADAELEAVMPFLLASRSAQEYAHRSALARESILSIAARCGIDEADLMATARRRYELYRHALAEGTDPLQALDPLLNGGGNGSGPEKPDEHTEGPDWSGGYSEVPQGAPGGPNPGVTRPRPPSAGPVQEATGSLRRTADDDTSPFMPMPPDTGVGSGSVDMSTPDPNMDNLTPSLPAGVAGNDTTPITPPSIGQVTSSADPVRRKVLAVTAAISATNPHLPQRECERVARQVVGRYLREADLAGSVMDDQPVSSGGSSGGSGSGDSSGGGVGGAIQHGLEWEGLKGLMGGGAGAGELAEAGAALAL